MKRIILIIGMVLLLAGNAFASSKYCAWDGSAPINCVRSKFAGPNNTGTEYIRVPGVGNVNVNAAFENGYYELVTIKSALLPGNMYEGHIYTLFATYIEDEWQQVVNPNAPTLFELKVQKFWNEKYEADLFYTEDCVYSGFIIPEETRRLMIDAIASGETVTYTVINETTGFPQGFTRTPQQAKNALTDCLQNFQDMNTRLLIDDDRTPEADDSIRQQIIDCPDEPCIDAIQLVDHGGTT